MELTEDEIIQKKPNVAGIVIETLYYHMNMNLLVLFVDITSINESTNSLKYKGKK